VSGRRPRVPGRIGEMREPDRERRGQFERDRRNDDAAPREALVERFLPLAERLGISRMHVSRLIRLIRRHGSWSAALGAALGP
jgi:hypothetical protein